MVYRKAKRYGRVAYRGYRKRRRVYVPAIRQLASDVNYIKGLVNSESKYHKLENSNNFDYNGVVVSLCNIAQGDQDWQRQGNSVLPRYFTMKLHVNKALAGVSDHTTFRVILFRYYGEATSAAPAVTPAEVLETVGTQYAPMSNLNPDNVGSKNDRSRRIQIHHSEICTLDKVSLTAKDFDWNVEINKGGSYQKDHLRFRSNATEAPIDGGFFLLLISDVITATDLAYYFTSVVRYYDN